MKHSHESHAGRSTAQVAKGTRGASLLPERTQGQVKAGVRANETQDDAVRPSETQDPDALAAVLFDRALKDAEINSEEVSQLLGISVSLVNRMRNRNARERVSFGQMLRLPPAFHIALHKNLNQQYGFGRAALRRLMAAAGDLALTLE